DIALRCETIGVRADRVVEAALDPLDKFGVQTQGQVATGRLLEGDEMPHKLFAERLQLDVEVRHVVRTGVRKVRPVEVRGGANCDEEVVYYREVHHPLDRDFA